MNSGLFIVLEGSDRVYVLTQFELLRKRLIKAGFEVLALQFPLVSQTSSYFVNQYLIGEYGSEEDISPYTASLFYAMDHYESAARIRDTLTTGGVVLATGYDVGVMAKQAAKLATLAERRGYYLWQERMEFDMLGLPRPNKTYVLQTALTASDNDLSLQAIYEDMCHLLPKDTQVLDLVRSQATLEADKANDIIWEAIQPLLPYQPDSLLSEIELALEPVYAPRTITASELLRSTLDMNGSLLDTQLLSSELTQQDGAYQYYIPAGLNDQLRGRYIEGLNEIFSLYADMLQQLTTYLHESHSAHQVPMQEAERAAMRILRPVLPLAVQSQVEIRTDDAGIGILLQQSASLLPGEVVDISKNFGLEELVAALNEQADTSDLGTLTVELLQGNYAEPTHNLVLSHVSPRNELDLVPLILYEHSNLGLAEITDSLASWSYDQKEAVLQAYLQDSDERVLEAAEYTWELLCDFGIFRELQQFNLGKRGLLAQPLTPRYGYSVAKVIETAGLDEQFDACFDISLRLHSELQAAGLKAEAQYACLFGHKIRCILTHTAADAPELLHSHSKTAYPGHNKLVAEMAEKLVERHPLLSARGLVQRKNG